MTAWKQWNVAITSMNARPDNPTPGCAVARCLREEAGFTGRIIGLGYETLESGFYLHPENSASFLLPYPATGSEALMERLDEILEVEPLDAIIPCLDTELPNFIALEPDLARRGIRLCLPSREQLRQRDKDRLPDLCQAAGISTPAVRHVTDESFFDSADKELSWPLMVKGLFYEAYVTHTAEEAKARFRQLTAQWGYPVLVQPFIKGNEVNLVALGDGEGGLLGAVMMRKQAVTDKGKAWAGVAIDDRELLAAAQKLMAILHWHGPFELEMLRDEEGRLHLIEINPRFPAWVYLSHGVGRNLPAALLAHMQGVPAEQLNFAPPSPGTHFIRYAEEVIVPLDDIAEMSQVGQRTAPQNIRALRVIASRKQ